MKIKKKFNDLFKNFLLSCLKEEKDISKKKKFLKFIKFFYRFFVSEKFRINFKKNSEVFSVSSN